MCSPHLCKGMDTTLRHYYLLQMRLQVGSVLKSRDGRFIHLANQRASCPELQWLVLRWSNNGLWRRLARQKDSRRQEYRERIISTRENIVERIEPKDPRINGHCHLDEESWSYLDYRTKVKMMGSENEGEERRILECVSLVMILQLLHTENS